MYVKGLRKTQGLLYFKLYREWEYSSKKYRLLNVTGRKEKYYETYEKHGDFSLFPSVFSLPPFKRRNTQQ